MNFTWFLNNEQLTPSDERVERLSTTETTGVLSLQPQKLNFNGQSKRLNLVITNEDVNNNTQSDSHEGWLFQVNNTSKIWHTNHTIHIYIHNYIHYIYHTYI